MVKSGYFSWRMVLDFLWSAGPYAFWEDSTGSAWLRLILSYFGLIEQIDLLLVEINLHLATTQNVQIVQRATGFILKLLEDLLCKIEQYIRSRINSATYHDNRPLDRREPNTSCPFERECIWIGLISNRYLREEGFYSWYLKGNIATPFKDPVRRVLFSLFDIRMPVNSIHYRWWSVRWCSSSFQADRSYLSTPIFAERKESVNLKTHARKKNIDVYSHSKNQWCSLPLKRD